MSTIIMDLCSYTRLGLTGYLLSRGVKKREINDIETVDDLAIACDSQRPSVVFINEDCFIHDASTRDNDNLVFKYADVIIEPNRIEYVANVDGRSGNHSNL